MLHYLKSVLIIALACVLVSCSSGQKDTLESRLDKFITKKNYSGSVLLVKDNKIEFAKGYKMADYSKDQPNGPDTIFQIGSLTKAFTAAAILQLAEAGKLSIDAPVHTYIKDYPNQSITLYHLLTHTSGIPNYTGFANFADIMDTHMSLSELIATFKDQPLEFELGSQFAYSNSGYVLLGAVIEQVSGQTYGDYLEEHIFTPLGMSRSGYLTKGNHKTDVAAGYSDTASEIPENALPIDMTIPYSAGGIYSTVEDLYKWLQGLENGTLLSEDSWKDMRTPNLANYAFGWGVTDSTGKVYSHNGGINGFTSLIWRDMSKGTAVILLSNSEQSPIGSMIEPLVDMLDSEKP